MNLQTIKSIDGKIEYVLLPVSIYQVLHEQIDAKLKKLEQESDYVPFNPQDYIDNPVTLIRIKAHLTQKQLAKLLNVTQAYISKIERQEKITPKLLAKFKEILGKNR